MRYSILQAIPFIMLTSKRYKTIYFSLLILGTCGCHSDIPKASNPSEDTTACCLAEPPPPPPPQPFKHIRTETLAFPYGDSIVHFQAALFTNRLFDLNGQYLQTFSVYAKNEHETDSFYFALPTSLNRFWGDITIVENDTSFRIGYYVHEEKFVSLYSLHLGAFGLNSYRIFMNPIDSVRKP